VRITVLGSGSRGNALVVDFGGTRLVVDVGFGPRAMVRRLREAGIDPASIAGAVITHEHQDHAQGALDMREKWRWPLIGSAGTLAALGTGSATSRLHRPAWGSAWTFEGVAITLHPIPHDAAAPAAVVLEDLRSGTRVGVAHDLGCVPDALIPAFTDLDAAVIEANHDPAMLVNGPYSPALQRRVAGGRGHLSNAQAGEWVSAIASRRLQHVVLAHLSEVNNTPSLAVAAVQGQARRRGYRGAVVAAAQRHAVTVGRTLEGQLTLW
jgi:phosphoribosyl 1,2-cyclic phosphodiesterase